MPECPFRANGCVSSLFAVSCVFHFLFRTVHIMGNTETGARLSTHQTRPKLLAYPSVLLQWWAFNESLYTLAMCFHPPFGIKWNSRDTLFDVVIFRFVSSPRQVPPHVGSVATSFM